MRAANREASADPAIAVRKRPTEAGSILTPVFQRVEALNDLQEERDGEEDPHQDQVLGEPLGEREVLCVSQFTLYGDARKGNRPSYVEAAAAEQAEPLYDRFCERQGFRQGFVVYHGKRPRS